MSALAPHPPAPPRPHPPPAEPRRFTRDPHRLATPSPASADEPSWLRRHGPSLAILAVLLPVIGLVHGINMGSAPGRLDDEGTYVAQAWALSALGELAHYTYWYDHPPLGWLQIGAWTWLTGAFDRSDTAIAAGREFMLVCHLISSALLFALARRLGLSRPFAALAVLLFGLSPVAVHHHRLVYLDNVAVAWLLAAFLLSRTPSRNLHVCTLAGVCFGIAVLTKETSLLLLPALAYGLAQNAEAATRRWCMTMFATGMVLIGSTYLLYATLKGELLPGPDHVSLWEGVRFQLFDRAGSGSVFDASSDAGRVVRDWLELDAWLLVAGALAALPALFVGRLRAIAIAQLILLATMLRGGYMPVPYVIGLLPFGALLIAGSLHALAAWRPLVLRPRGGVVYGTSPASARRATLLRGGAIAAAVTTVVIGVVTASSGWVRGIEDLHDADGDRSYRQVTQWIAANLDPASDVVLTDDAMWLDLVSVGFGVTEATRDGSDPDRNVVWFYKLDTDPAVQRRFPQGYRDIDYVVSSPNLRGAVGAAGASSAVPSTGEALENSVPVVAFGRGGERLEVRRIVKD